MEANWHGAIAGDDPEFLHRLRVAIRRTRATLASAKGVVDSKDRRLFAREFRRIAAATGDARDYDVAVLDWPARVAALDDSSRGALAPIYDALAARRMAAHERLNAELTRRRTRRFMRKWRRWLARQPRRRGRRAHAPIGKTIKRQHRKLAARIDKFEGVDSIEARHALRKSAKRLRYIVDGFDSLYDDAQRSELTDRLVRMQDDLGRGRDAAVQAEMVRSIAQELHPTAPQQRAVDELLAVLDRGR